MKQQDTQWYWRMLILGTVAFIVDRLLKYVALRYLQEGIVVIPGIFHLEFFGNTNILFYLEIPAYVLYALVVLVMFAVVYLAAREYQQGYRFRVAMMMFVFIGAFSNLIDRMHYGFVIDFIRIPFWSVFNFADIYIVGGVLVLLVDTWKHDHRTKKIPETN